MPLRSAKKALRASLDRAAYLFGPHINRFQNDASSDPKLWILMYHRILPKSDPRYALEEPGMLVQPDTFKMQLEFVQRHFTVLPLKNWIARRQAGETLPAKTCAITFDDGWKDNYEYAFPILRQYQTPATLFAVSHMIGTQQMFWPNQLATLLKQPLETLQTLPWLAPHLNAFNKHSDEKEAVAAIIDAFKSYPDDQIRDWLDNSGFEANSSGGLMSWDELREMEASGLVDIGSHTCHHYRLKQDLNPLILRRELEDSKSTLEKQLGKPVPLFCYPNGDVCDLALQSVPRHYQAAVTTRRGINTASKLSPYELLRIGVHEDRCSTRFAFASRIANWY